jgi:hypothetical protein
MALSPVARPPGIAGAAPVRADIRRSRRVLPVGFYDRWLGDDPESAELIKLYRADDMAGERAGQQGGQRRRRDHRPRRGGGVTSNFAR